MQNGGGSRFCRNVRHFAHFPRPTCPCVHLFKKYSYQILFFFTWATSLFSTSIWKWRLEIAALFHSQAFVLSRCYTLPSPHSSKARSDNKFRQRKMSSLCIVGMAWFDVPWGISKYVSAVINQLDTRTEMTLVLFIWSFYTWERCQFCVAFTHTPVILYAAVLRRQHFPFYNSPFLHVGPFDTFVLRLLPYSHFFPLLFPAVELRPVRRGEARRGENVRPPDPRGQVPRPRDGHAAHPEDREHPDGQTRSLGKLCNEVEAKKNVTAWHTVSSYSPSLNVVPFAVMWKKPPRNQQFVKGSFSSIPSWFHALISDISYYIVICVSFISCL